MQELVCPKPFLLCFLLFCINIYMKELLTPLEQYDMAQWDLMASQGWYLATVRDGQCVWLREQDRAHTTRQQASIQKYNTIWELNKNQLQVLLGKDYREELFKDWETARQKPLQEYKEWLSRRA